MTPPVYFLNPFLSLSGDKANKEKNPVDSKFMTVFKENKLHPPALTATFTVMTVLGP